MCLLKVKTIGNSYKTLRSIIHQTKLKALLILESFSQSVAQAVRREHALSALLKLAENTLGKMNTQIVSSFTNTPKENLIFARIIGANFLPELNFFWFVCVVYL